MSEVVLSMITLILKGIKRFIFNFPSGACSFNKLFDYLSVGKPVIYGGSSSNNAVEEARAGVVVPPEDPEANTGSWVFHTPFDWTHDGHPHPGKYVKVYSDAASHAMARVQPTLRLSRLILPRGRSSH